MSMACLQTEEKRVARTAFKRYHAALQVDNDARIVWLGAVIYVLALRPVLANPAPAGGPFVAVKVLFLGLSTLWPFALRIWSHEWLLRWRDEFFIAHWLLHHVVGPRVLTAAGPIVLALQWSEEQAACRASAVEYPELTSAAFGSIAGVLRNLTRSSSWSHEPPIDDAMSLCCKVDAFFVIMVAYVLPGVVIWYLEQHTWQDFTRVDPGLLTWSGGPDARQISLIQKKMRREYKKRVNFYYTAYDGRIMAIAFVVAATLWQLLDSSNPFAFVKSSIT